MTTKQKTIIVTGASQGIGAAVAKLFLDRGYNVVGNSRKISQKNELPRSDKLALVDGDIGLASTADMIVGTALQRFGFTRASEMALLADLTTYATKAWVDSHGGCHPGVHWRYCGPRPSSGRLKSYSLARRIGARPQANIVALDS